MGDYDAALATLLRAGPFFQQARNQVNLAWLYNNIGGIHHARGEYGPALAMYHKEALKKLAERAIAGRGRGNYQDAAGHLQRVREQHRRLRALLEELDKAGCKPRPVGHFA